MRPICVVIAALAISIFSLSAYADPEWGEGCQQNGGLFACHKEFIASTPYWWHDEYHQPIHYSTEQEAKDGFLLSYPDVCNATWTPTSSISGIPETCSTSDYDGAPYEPDILISNFMCTYYVSVVCTKDCRYSARAYPAIIKTTKSTCKGEGFHLAKTRDYVFYCENQNPGEDYGVCAAGVCENLDVGEQSCKAVGNPVDSSNGNKMQREIDYAPIGAVGLQFVRYYNSATNVKGSALGPRWRTNFDRSLEFTNLPDGTRRITAYRQDGKSVFLTALGNIWYSSSTSLKVSTVLNGTSFPSAKWVLTDTSDNLEYYDEMGKLLQARSFSGRIQNMFYDAANRLQKVEDKYGHALSFTMRIRADSGNLPLIFECLANTSIVRRIYSTTTLETIPHNWADTFKATLLGFRAE